MYETIEQYLVALVPALTAVITIIVSMVSAIVKTKKMCNKTIESVDESLTMSRLSESELAKSLERVISENIKLKQDLDKILSNPDIQYILKKDENSNETN